MSWHRRLVQCTLAVGALMSSCSSGPSTEGGCPGATYPDWQTSPYVLPIAVGQSVKIDLSNCSGSYHSLGEPDAYAIDFKMAIGTRVVAARGGTVVYVQESGNDGGFPNNLVAVNHGDGTYGQYMHLTRDGAEVTVGTRVEPGDLIGYSGNTGLAGYPHLHFVVTIGGFGYPYESIPVTFRNTSPNPFSLISGETYRARAY
ncbi:MAG: M23 family metallopeptidase [Gemmatimonadales bacterium]